MDSEVARVLRDTITALDDEIAAAQATVARLRLERQGVETALKRFGSQPTADRPGSALPPLSRETPTSGSQPREQAEDSGTGLASKVLDLLRAADHPLSVAEIVQETDLDTIQARSAVGYLKRKGAVHNPVRGLWEAVDPTDTETAPAYTETVSAPIHQQMKGGGAHGDTVSATAGVRDLHSLRTTVDRDHSDGASVVVEAHG